MNKRKELVKELIREFDLKDTNDISSMFCEWMGDTIQEMAFFEKRMKSEYSDIHIKVPQNRNSEFEPQIVKKYQKDLGMIEHQILT